MILTSFLLGVSLKSAGCGLFSRRFIWLRRDSLLFNDKPVARDGTTKTVTVHVEKPIIVPHALELPAAIKRTLLFARSLIGWPANSKMAPFDIGVVFRFSDIATVLADDHHMVGGACTLGLTCLNQIRYIATKRDNKISTAQDEPA